MLIFSEGIADFVQILVFKVHLSVLEYKRIISSRGQQTFSVKGQRVNMFDSVATGFPWRLHPTAVAARRLPWTPPGCTGVLCSDKILFTRT